MEAIYTLTEQQVWAIAGAAFMMLFDLVSGFAAAVINKEVSSSKMREGLAHKMVLLLFIALSLAVEVLSLHVADFGFGGGVRGVRVHHRNGSREHLREPLPRIPGASRYKADANLREREDPGEGGIA